MRVFVWVRAERVSVEARYDIILANSQFESLPRTALGELALERGVYQHQGGATVSLIYRRSPQNTCIRRHLPQVPTAACHRINFWRDWSTFTKLRVRCNALRS